MLSRKLLTVKDVSRDGFVPRTICAMVNHWPYWMGKRPKRDPIEECVEVPYASR